MLRYRFRSLAAGLCVFASLTMAVAGTAEAQGTFSEERIRFARGAHGATVTGKVSRSAALVYRVGAKAGQKMAVMLDGDAKTAFDLSGPKDTSGQAMASSATEWEGALPDDGDYKILVFTEDRVKAPFTLKITID